MAIVCWQKLILRGFGPYREEAGLELGGGTNVIVAPNEAGKSTLTAGLAAVLFGLSSSSDAAKFSQGRFRNWEKPARFEGELHFLVDGVDYRLQRRFDSHRVLLRRSTGPSQWEPIVEGVDNPDGRKPLTRYHEELQQLLGINSLAVFRSTYYLAQPLPNVQNLDETLQQILSGAGNRYTLVLEQLAQGIKGLTRYYGQPLGLASNGRLDQQLEKITQEAEALEAAIELSEQTVDGLQAIGEELHTLGERRQKLLKILTTRERLKEAWIQWRSEQERHDAALERCQQIEQASARAQHWADRRDELLHQLRDDYADYLACGEGAARRIEDVSRLELRLAGITQDLTSCQAELEARQGEFQELKAQAAALPAVLGQPSLLADHSKLLELAGAKVRLENRRAELERSIEESQSQLSHRASYADFGEHPSKALADLRQFLAEQGQIFDRVMEFRRQRQRLATTLHQEYGPFLAATPQQRQEIAQFRQRHWELSQRVQETERIHQAILERYKAHAAEMEDLVKVHGPLTGTPADVLALIDSKVRLLDGVSRAANRQSASAGLSLLGAGGVGAAAMAAALWLWGLRNGFIGWLVSGGFGAAVFWFTHRWLQGQRLNPLQQEQARIDERLGPLAALDWSALVDLRSRLEKLTRMAVERPSQDRLDQAEQEAQDARAVLEHWQQAMRPFTASYADPQAAQQEWQWLEQQIAELDREIQSLAEQGATPEASIRERIMLRPGMAQLAGLVQVSVESLEELFDRLLTHDANWKLVLEQACCWEEQQLRLRQAEQDLQQLDQPGSDGSTAFERIDAEIAALTEGCRPFGVDTPPAELQRQISLYQRLAQQLAASSAQVDLLERRQQGLQIQSTETLRERQQAIDPIALLWRSRGGDLSRVRQGHDAYLRLNQQLNEAQQGLSEALRAHHVTTLTELERLRLDQSLAVVASTSRWQALIDDHPGLPSITEAHHSQKITERYEALGSELEQMRARRDALDQREVMLLKEKATFEGRAPLNVAAAHDKLKALREQKVKVEAEIAALSLAHQELRAAIVDYESSYRERLAERANAYHQRITGDRQRIVELGDDFRVSCRTAEGHLINPEQLSQGTRDQLYLSLRLAIADLMSDQTTLPFVFDDPFVNCDQERLARIHEMLNRLGRDRQILLLTHQSDFASWGQTVSVKIKS